MADAGAAVVVPDGELDPGRLSREVGSLLAAPDRLREMSSAARRVARPDAAQRIADEVLGGPAPYRNIREADAVAAG